MIKGLNHNAYRCRDSEETRQFYEDVRGLPLANAFKIAMTMTGRDTVVLHSFYEMGDESFLAFFEVPDRDFEFKVRELSFGDRVSLRLDKQAQGLMVENVEAAGWASLAGLRQGDVILKVDGKPINAITEFRNRMEAIAEKRPERVIFFIKRGIHTMFVEFEPNWENP